MELTIIDRKYRSLSIEKRSVYRGTLYVHQKRSHIGEGSQKDCEV